MLYHTKLKRNLIRNGNEFPYGQIAVSEANECWEKAEKIFDLQKMRNEVAQFNSKNQLYKKGIALMPVAFGISFTKTLMNQARALVHVYTDGSVNVSTGAVEMGQGVNTKILQVAAQIFSIDPAMIRVNSTNTFRIANTSPSAASATADLNGRATQIACEAILNRLKEVAAMELNTTVDSISVINQCVFVKGEKSSLDWRQLIMAAYLRRVSLSEHGHYATPEISFDAKKEKGHPFAYHVYGSAILTVTIDCLRGTYEFDSVNVVHDFGASMNVIIDRGQVEGGIVQGIGWMTMEEVIYDKDGRLRSNALSTYKVPDVYSVPKEINIDFLQTNVDNLAIFRSKAVGEPPLMYGIGAFFALREAMKAFNPNAKSTFESPMTPERVLMTLHSDELIINN